MIAPKKNDGAEWCHLSPRSSVREKNKLAASITILNIPVSEFQLWQAITPGPRQLAHQTVTSPICQLGQDMRSVMASLHVSMRFRVKVSFD